ncbi:MAG: c-type cytochrome [Chloroflexi bacterium]|nr:c-type cytochrome [Chloroflexota bacterium]
MFYRPVFDPRDPFRFIGVRATKGVEMPDTREFTRKEQGEHVKNYLLASVVAAVIMVGWIVAYLTTYNVGYTSGENGLWFAETQVAKEGWSQFQSAGCAQCHSILGQQGQSAGPDLTYVGKRWKADQIKQLVRNPRSIFPNTMMPAFTRQSDEEIDKIARYLETLK